MNGDAIIDAILLLLVANGAPILARNALGKRCAWSIDGGIRRADGRRLFGSHKTWRGLAAAVLACAALAPWLERPVRDAVILATAAMCGDLLSSFAKRRRGLAPGAPVLVLDQVPESLLPLALLAGPWGMDLGDVALACAAFFVLDLVLSRLLYLARVRARPR